MPFSRLRLIDEDVQRANHAILDMRDVEAGHCRRAIWLTAGPLQPSYAIVPERRSNGVKAEVCRHLCEQLAHRLRYGLVALSRVLWLVQDRVGGVKLTDCRHAAGVVALAKDAQEVRLHDGIVIENVAQEALPKIDRWDVSCAGHARLVP